MDSFTVAGRTPRRPPPTPLPRIPTMLGGRRCAAPSLRVGGTCGCDGAPWGGAPRTGSRSLAKGKDPHRGDEARISLTLS